MTIVAIWRQDYANCSIWACSDSRISPKTINSPILQNSPKIFPLQIVVTRPTLGSPQPEDFFKHTFGMAYSGSSIFGLSLYAYMVPILANLRGDQGASASIGDAARLARDILNEFAHSYRTYYPNEKNSIEVAFFGFCKATEKPVVFSLKSEMNPGGRADECDAILQEIDISSPEHIHLMGDPLAFEAFRKNLLAKRANHHQKSAMWQLAPCDVIRELIGKQNHKGIGGAIQLAQTSAFGMQQYMDLNTVRKEFPDFDHLGFTSDDLHVGDCWFCLPAIVPRSGVT